MAKDLIHAAVREAQEKDGWKVLQDPFTIALPDDDTYFDIDLSAEKSINKGKPCVWQLLKSNHSPACPFYILFTRRSASF